MPIIIKCSNCGFVLYEGGLTTIEDVLKRWAFRCPVCLSTLETKPVRWEIRWVRDHVPGEHRYKTMYERLKMKREPYVTYCKICEKPIRPGAVYYASTSGGICLRCFIKERGRDEIDLVKRVLREKFGWYNVDKVIEVLLKD